MCPRPVPPPPRAAEEQPDSQVAVLESPLETPAEAWVTIVWDDPVNLMDYVTHVFCEYFGYPKPKSEELMLKVHTEGRAVVSAGNREAMERDVLAMQNYTLWATMDVAGCCVSSWNATHATWNRCFPMSNPTIPW